MGSVAATTLQVSTVKAVTLPSCSRMKAGVRDVDVATEVPAAWMQPVESPSSYTGRKQKFPEAMSPNSACVGPGRFLKQSWQSTFMLRSTLHVRPSQDELLTRTSSWLNQDVPSLHPNWRTVGTRVVSN